MQSFIEIGQRDREHAADKGSKTPDFYGPVGRPIEPAPVLLFELKHLQPAVNRQPGYRRDDS